MAAYGASPRLQQAANLVIVAGTREDIRTLEESQRAIMTDLLLDIDRHDIWGKVALPKHIPQEDIPTLYQWAARSRGVFVNPALTEPFAVGAHADVVVLARRLALDSVFLEGARIDLADA